MSDVAETIYQTDFTGAFLVADQPESRILVADSWLVSHGMVIAMDLHRQRFFNSCYQRHQMDSDILQHYWQAALKKIPRDGLWFPRIELAGDPDHPKLQMRIRPAPPLNETIRLSLCPSPDRRQAPRHKGADMGWLMQMRQQVLAQGADEGIIVSPKGYLLEGLTTSLLWWEEHKGQPILCAVPDANRILPGTIRQLILSIAGQKNIPVAYRRVQPEQLAGCNVWAVNALHGIRPAIPWQKAPFMPKHDAETEKRLKTWHLAIEACAAPLPV